MKTGQQMKQDIFKGKKILISGGLGFMGSNLAIRLVKEGADVTIIDSLIPEYGGNLWNIAPIKDQVKINISDVRDEHSMQYLIKDQEYFFNLAGQTSHLDSMNNPFTDLDINAKAQLSILEACRKYNPTIKVIFASTRQLYGKPLYLPVDEKHPVCPVDVNGINKMSGEGYHIVYNKVYGIQSVILRFTNTFGPRMRIKDARQTFLGIWVNNLIQNKPISKFGDGCQVRDYNYIDDVVDAFLLVASSTQWDGTIYNLGNNDPISLKRTAELMIDENSCGEFEFKKFPSDLKKIDIGNYYSDFSKIKNKLGWSPKTANCDGFRKTIDYYKENFEHYV